MCILAIGDEQNCHIAITRASQRHSLSCEHAETSAVAGKCFDSSKPELVIFCFDDIIKSETAVKNLYAHSEIAAFSDFRTLLLCAKHESQTALELCMDRIFDDYLVAKPLQDSIQLEWRIQSLLDSERNLSKTVLRTVLDQVQELKSNLVENNLELTSPDSLSNTLRKLKFDELQDDLKRELLIKLAPILTQGATPTTSNPSQSLMEKNINASIGNYSLSVEEVIEKFIQTLAKRNQNLNNNLNTVFKVTQASMKPTVLIVDDNSGFREPVKEMLTDEGYRVITSDAGTKAVGMIIREAPDLVLMDYQMPAMNGIETIKQVRELLNGAKSPLIFLVTGQSSQDIVHLAKELGIDGFLVKPLRRTALLQKVNEKLGRKKGEG